MPEPDELVLVRYECPVAECSKDSEGWMEFGRTRHLFFAGVIRYLTRGRLRRTRPRDQASLLWLRSHKDLG